jgi:TolB protein
MTAPRDPDTLVRAFLAEGVSELSPRVIGAIRDDVRRSHQRAARRPWRTTRMPRLLFILAPVAALALLAAALLAGVGSQHPAPTPSPAASAVVVAPPTSARPTIPAPTPTAVAVVPLPDGQPWVAYESEGGGVSLIRPDGTGQHHLLDGVGIERYTPAWSPDGRRIVMAVNVGPGSELWIVNADGSAATRLVPVDPACRPVCRTATAPRWSPDGRSIGFVDTTLTNGGYTSSSISKVDVATGAITLVYPDGRLLRWFAWAPDGRRIAVQADTFADAPSLEASPTGSEIDVIDISEPQRWTGSRVQGMPPFAGHPDWSPTGDRLVFRTNGYTNGQLQDPSAGTTLQTIGIDGSSPTTLVTSPAGAPLVRGPAWTPDGTQVLFAFLSTGQVTSSVLQVVNADGTGAGSLTPGTETLGGEPRLRPTP